MAQPIQLSSTLNNALQTRTSIPFSDGTNSPYNIGWRAAAGNGLGTATAARNLRMGLGTDGIAADIAEKLGGLAAMEILAYPDEIPKYYVAIDVSDYKRTNFMQIASTQRLASIILPLPYPLAQNHQVDYQQQPLGAFMGNAGNALASAMNGNQGTNIRQGTSGIEGNLTNALAAGTVQTIREATNALGLPDAVGAAQSWFGFAPNQFFVVLLKGPTYRQYQFSWQLSPKTPHEARMLKEMIRKINNWKAPTLAAGGALFTFPKVFRPKFYPNSQYLFKFKPSVVTNLVAVYSHNNQPAFLRRDNDTNGLNAPEGIDLSISFMELEYWLNGNFTDTNNPEDTSQLVPDPITSFADFKKFFGLDIVGNALSQTLNPTSTGAGDVLSNAQVQPPTGN